MDSVMSARRLRTPDTNDHLTLIHAAAVVRDDLPEILRARDEV
jgi:hypothetical protein